MMNVRILALTTLAIVLIGVPCLSQTASSDIARSPGEPAADGADRRRWIESVDVTGDAAVARIYSDALITDYMTLLKIDGHTSPESESTEPDAATACVNPAYRASDYLLGSWVGTVKVPAADGQLEEDPTVESRMEVERMAGGCGLVERRVVMREEQEPIHLFTVRAFDTNDDEWDQLLVGSNQAVIDFRGEPTEEGLSFIATRPDATMVRVLERPVGDSGFNRMIEVSTDGGESWNLEDVVEYRAP